MLPGRNSQLDGYNYETDQPGLGTVDGDWMARLLLYGPAAPQMYIVANNFFWEGAKFMAGNVMHLTDLRGNIAQLNKQEIDGSIAATGFWVRPLSEMLKPHLDKCERCGQ